MSIYTPALEVLISSNRRNVTADSSNARLGWIDALESWHGADPRILVEKGMTLRTCRIDGCNCRMSDLSAAGCCIDRPGCRPLEWSEQRYNWLWARLRAALQTNDLFMMLQRASVLRGEDAECLFVLAQLINHCVCKRKTNVNFRTKYSVKTCRIDQISFSILSLACCTDFLVQICNPSVQHSVAVRLINMNIQW